MRTVTPDKIWGTVKNTGNFYHIVCFRAGLNPGAPDVQRAFDELIKEGQNEQ